MPQTVDFSGKPSPVNGYGGVLPAGRLAPLLAAALGPDAPAAAWADYVATGGPGLAGEGERRLYPLVGARLGDAATGNPEFASIARQKRAALLRSVILFAAAGHIVDLFQQADIAPIFLKGVALQIRAYRDTAIRASSDVDILIAPEQVAACLALIEADGWDRLDAWPRRHDARIAVAVGGRMSFVMPTGVMVDIHWVPRTALEFDAEAQRLFRDGAIERQYRGRSWHVPSDAALLFETIAHGVRQNPQMPIRWLADAVTLLRQPDCNVDWAAWCDLVERAKIRPQAALAARAMAAYTDTIPPDVVSRLELPPSRLEQLYLSVLLQPLPWLLQGIGLAAIHYFLRRPAPFVRRLVGFPAYYRRRILRCFTWGDWVARIGEKLGAHTHKAAQARVEERRLPL